MTSLLRMFWVLKVSAAVIRATTAPRATLLGWVGVFPVPLGLAVLTPRTTKTMSLLSKPPLVVLVSMKNWTCWLAKSAKGTRKVSPALTLSEPALMMSAAGMAGVVAVAGIAGLNTLRAAGPVEAAP